jgi:hypothetical protein
MKRRSTSLALSIAGFLAAGAGCSSSSVSSDGGGPRDAATDAAVAPRGVVLTPDPTGWIMGKNTTTKSIQGAWYAYGDHYGAGGASPGDCDSPTKGMHPISDCSLILTPEMPPQPLVGFANDNGKMCTSGTLAAVVNGTDGTPDFVNVWGAGIGLDLNSSGGDQAVKSPYDALANGITGFSFNIDTPPDGALRVEFPTATETLDPFWDGAAMVASPVVAGTNVVRWADVNGPYYQTTPPPPPMLDATTILSIKFHVFPNISGPVSYSFCVSNLTALTN